MSDAQTSAKGTPAGEAARRRTFAIISHPDAGKTTLTEHLLLLGGAIRAAGQVKARGEARRARSDWMKIEQERGISVTSAVMTFEYGGRRLQPARHAGPRGFLRRHLPHAHRRRFRGDGDRRRQGHRGADPQAVRGLPPARHPDHDLHQQDGPRGARAAGTDRRDRRPASARMRPHELAGRHGAELQGRARSLCRPLHSLRRPKSEPSAIGNNALAEFLGAEGLSPSSKRRSSSSRPACRISTPTAITKAC